MMPVFFASREKSRPRKPEAQHLEVKHTDNDEFTVLVQKRESCELVTLDKPPLPAGPIFRLGKVVSGFDILRSLFKAQVSTQSKCFLIHLEITEAFPRTKGQFDALEVRYRLCLNTR